MKFRVIMSSPAYLVFRRYTVEADDAESAIETVKFMVLELNRDDPDAQYWVKEVTV